MKWTKYEEIEILPVNTVLFWHFLKSLLMWCIYSYFIFLSMWEEIYFISILRITRTLHKVQKICPYFCTKTQHPMSKWVSQKLLGELSCFEKCSLFFTAPLCSSWHSKTNKKNSNYAAVKNYEKIFKSKWYFRNTLDTCKGQAILLFFLCVLYFLLGTVDFIAWQLRTPKLPKYPWSPGIPGRKL